jgi:hypothetical protein
MSESAGSTGGNKAGSDESDGLEADALLSRLRVIEDQPLEARAAAFAQINQELQARLDGDTATAG